MPNYCKHITPALVIGAFAVGLCSARADDAEPVKEKLFQAKKEYDGEVQRFKQSVQDVFDKREELARAKGDKKAVDQVKAEREAFTKEGSIPATLPMAVKKQITAARSNLDGAYTAAVKDYVRLKLDKAADAAEKERQEFQLSAAFLFGKTTFLSSLKPFDIRVFGTWFEKDGNKFKLNGEIVPHTLQMHPDAKGVASVSYAIQGKAVAFRTTVGIPRYTNPQYNPASPVTFEILGDGTSLWKSEPVKVMDEFQSCTVNVEKVKTLTLRVQCRDHGWAHATWFGPVVVE